MNAKDYWTIFVETGAPEMYLLYNKARRMEEQNVYNDPGIGPSGVGLQ